MTTNVIEKYILEAYCEGKNMLWNMFLGWRRSHSIDYKIEESYYWIPTDKVATLQGYAVKIKALTSRWG
jgi:hypothetical protein